MPLNGIDHVELYVGNAKQAAFYYCHAFGFREVAYAGLETGVRDRTSHVLRQGRITLVLTGALGSESRDRRAPPQARRRREGDRARRCRDADARLPRRRSSAAPTGVAEPHELSDEHGTVAPRDDRDLRRDAAHVRRARRLHGAVPARLRRARGRGAGRRHAAGDRPHRRQRRARPHGRVGQVLRGRLRHARDAALLRRGHLDGVLRADVEGRRRRQGAREVPDQRAGRGQAQVADRRVPRVLRGRRARSTSPSPRATSSGRSTELRRARRRVPARSPDAYYDEVPARVPEIDRAAGRPARARASSSTATTRATCCRSSPSRSATGRRCSSRSSSATARAASATATSRRCSRRSSASRRCAGTSRRS